MGRNAHKNTWPVAQLPFQADSQNRRFPECGKPFFVLADTSDSSGYKNDVRGVYLKRALSTDTIDFYVELNGVQLTPLGSPVYFPNDPLVAGFVVDWRQHLAITGPGCYRIKVEANLAGLAVDYYEGSYNVQPWSIDRAMGTVRLYSKFDSYNREKDVNFKESGFIDSIRFNGFFGKMQPNTEVNNLIGVNRELRKVTRRNDKTYELQSDPLNICHTKRIIDDHLIDENLILVCDHNSHNHSYEYRDLGCIVDEVGEVGYNEGRGAIVNATFKDKYALNKSMFINGMMNGITPTPPAPSCDPANVENSDGSYTATVASGGTLILPDETINLVDEFGNPISTFTFPVYTDPNIDITSYCPAPADATAVLKDTSGNTLSTTNIPSGTSDDIIAPDADVENSDASYTASVESGGTLVLPDSDVNVNGNLEGTVVSVQPIDIDVTDGTNPVTPTSIGIVGNTVTIEVPAAGGAPVGATLMKTGQTTSYRTGDDADTRAEGRAVDFFTLASNNPFGNTDRFTDELGGTTYANDIVIDWSTYDGATVLGYYCVAGSTNINWDNSIDGALATSVGSFTIGWRLPNLNEMQNLVDIGTAGSRTLVYLSTLGAGNLAGNNSFWTASTARYATNSAYALVNNTANINIAAKTSTSVTTAPNLRYFPCRTFTVTGTTLT
jgi:hypothetical protein